MAIWADFMGEELAMEFITGCYNFPPLSKEVVDLGSGLNMWAFATI